jgi:hypothetical protein
MALASCWIFEAISCGATATGCTLAQPTAAAQANASKLKRRGRWIWGWGVGVCMGMFPIFLDWLRLFTFAVT